MQKEEKGGRGVVGRVQARGNEGKWRGEGRHRSVREGGVEGGGDEMMLGLQVRTSPLLPNRSI